MSNVCAWLTGDLLEKDKERCMDCSARRSLTEVGVISLACALATVLIDIVLMTAPVESMEWLTSVLSVVSLALPVLL